VLCANLSGFQFIHFYTVVYQAIGCPGGGCTRRSTQVANMMGGGGKAMFEPLTPLRLVVLEGMRRWIEEQIGGSGIGSILGAYIPPPAGLLWLSASVGW